MGLTCLGEMLLQVRHSVIGRDCHIGKGVQIHGCYIHNGVTIGDGAHLQSAVVCDGAVIMPEAVLCSRCIVSYQVCLSPQPLGKLVHCPYVTSLFCRQLCQPVS